MKWGTALLLLLAVLCFIYAPEIIGFFRDDTDVIAVGMVALRFQSIVLPLNAFIVMTNMMLQSIGKGFKASITASARNGIFFIPLILILPVWFGLRGVEVTQSIADLLTMFISLPFAISELKKWSNN